MACQQTPVQYPVQYESNDQFMKASQERAKKINEIQEQQILTYLENDSLDFTQTTFGTRISNQAKSTPEMAVVNDWIKYEYSIENLEKEVIYSKDEIGVQEAVLGKTNLMRGLHGSLQLIAKGDSASLILPSFSAYGGVGDRKRIGPDTPIVLRLKVIDIKK